MAVAALEIGAMSRRAPVGHVSRSILRACSSKALPAVVLRNPLRRRLLLCPPNELGPGLVGVKLPLCSLLAPSLFLPGEEL